MRDCQNLTGMLLLLALPLVALPVTMQASLDLLSDGPDSFACRIPQCQSDFSTKGKSPLMQLISLFKRIWTVCCKSANGGNRTLEEKQMHR